MSSTMTTEAVRELRNVDEFKAEFRKYSDAGRGVYLVRTREPQRAMEALQDLTIEDNTIFKSWSFTKGWQDFHSPSKTGEVSPEIRKPANQGDATTIDILKAFEKIKTKEGHQYIAGMWVMHLVHPVFEKPPIWAHIKELTQIALDNPIRVVFICTDNATVPPEIKEDIRIIDFRTPSHAELVDAWHRLVETSFVNFPDGARPEFTEEQVDEVVQNAIGLTQMEFEEAASIAAVSHVVAYENAEEAGEELPECTTDLFIASIGAQKVQAIKQTDILELMPSAQMDEVGGFKAVKEWLALHALAFSKEAAEYGIPAPKGLLCVGPPGGGKSLFAKAVASVFKTPLVKLDLGKVFDKYVGNSESRIRSALQTVDDMAPCVLLIDEIDKGFGGVGSGGDSGVGQRVLGTFLTWMQERDARKAPVFVVMTANNVTGLPAELLRKGRVDEIFACTFPDRQEREEILNIHFAKRGHTPPDLHLILDNTNKFVGAELESIVTEGLLKNFEAGRKIGNLDPRIFFEISKTTIPLSQSMAEKVEHMNKWAEQHAKSASAGGKFVANEEAKTEGSRQLTVRKVLPRKPIKPGVKLDN